MKRRTGRVTRNLARGGLLAVLLCSTFAAGQSQEGGGEETQDPPTEPPAAAGEQVAPAEPAAQEEPAEAPPTPEPARYRDAGEVAALVTGWLGSGLAERIEVGASVGGRTIEAIQFGGGGATPLSERPTIFLVGGLDGVSLAGAEAVLRVTGELLAAPDKLPAEATFVAIPWANPDGLERWMRSGTGDGRNDRSVDDDRDGTADEDAPDDVDGDEVVLSLLLEDRDGPWARADDDRLLRPARPGDGQRYRLVREGRDDDGDGRFNEDGPGGVVPDLNFPVGWRGPWTGAPSGRWPLSEPAARALADLAIERRTAAMLVFQGNHGRIASPGGVPLGDEVPDLPADRVAFEHVTERFNAATGRAQAGVRRLAEARGEERPGAAIDWSYVALGALSFEVAPWGPRVEGAARKPKATDARYGREEAGGEHGERQAPAREREWASWLDNTRGGIGFIDWQPIDLGGGAPGAGLNGVAGWIGGWEPRTRVNPPPELLPDVLRGMSSFVLELANGLPVLDVEAEAVRESGDVVVLRARLRNRGALPTGVGPLGGEPARGGASLTLRVPEGAELLVGEETVALGHVAGRGASTELTWLLLAPEGAVLALEARAPWHAPVEKVVRP